MAPGDRDAIKKSVEATKAEYKQLGKCGLRVSVPIFGAMSFGSPGKLESSKRQKDQRKKDVNVRRLAELGA
jgi:aryl-alcohol dehydrogenase-like predicted oxidoreductase